MKKKLQRAGIFFGGMSNEAEVSIMSAKNVYQYIDRTKFKPILVFWTTKGAFTIVENFDNLHNGREVRIEALASKIDIAFLVTHGKYGEDGALQSLLEINNIAYTGCGVLSSALCMDKAMNKTYLERFAIPQVPFEVIDVSRVSRSMGMIMAQKAIKKLRLPVYVKPAHSGSSIGITKVERQIDLKSALSKALRVDSKIVIERGVEKPREIEVGVLGNNKLIISDPGELLLAKDFYDYDDKYKKGEATCAIPASLTSPQKKEIQRLAKKIYEVCDCRGYARIDFFINKKGKVFFNEINTLPGFTDISMFPMLMKRQGISFSELLTKIIRLAV